MDKEREAHCDQRGIAEAQEGAEIGEQVVAAFSPSIRQHLHRFGRYQLDLSTFWEQKRGSARRGCQRRMRTRFVAPIDIACFPYTISEEHSEECCMAEKAGEIRWKVIEPPHEVISFSKESKFIPTPFSEERIAEESDAFSWEALRLAEMTSATQPLQEETHEVPSRAIGVEIQSLYLPSEILGIAGPSTTTWRLAIVYPSRTRISNVVE